MVDGKNCSAPHGAHLFYKAKTGEGRVVKAAHLRPHPPPTLTHPPASPSLHEETPANLRARRSLQKDAPINHPALAPKHHASCPKQGDFTPNHEGEDKNHPAPRQNPHDASPPREDARKNHEGVHPHPHGVSPHREDSSPCTLQHPRILLLWSACSCFPPAS